VTLTADASDNLAVDHVDFLVNGTVVATVGAVPYSAPWDSTSVADGLVSIAARAMDTSSNSTTSASHTVAVDNTAPQTTINAGPNPLVSNAAATFSFSSNEAGATFQCGLDGAPLAACNSPSSPSGLGDGPHTFGVQATDPAGNADLTPATWSWRVDTTHPETTINTGPSGTVSIRLASFAFSSNETGSTFECALDGASLSLCTSPASYSALADGPHKFVVRATDPAGNVDMTAASQSWLVDPVAFTDGFESGDFSNWTSVHTAINGSATVQSDVVRTGSFAAALAAPSSTSYAYARKTLLQSEPEITVSGDFQITMEGSSGKEVPIFKLYDSSGTRLVYLYRRNDSGRVYVVYGTTTYSTSAKLPLGTWANFSVHVIAGGTGTSTIQVSMNGSLIYQTTTASLGTSGIRTIQIGNDKQLPFALYGDNIVARI